MDNTLNKKVLVVGGTGYIGHSVVKVLRSKGYSGFFSFFQNKIKAQHMESEYGFRSVFCDLTKTESVQDMMREIGGEIGSIVFCASHRATVGKIHVEMPQWMESEMIYCASPYSIIRQFVKVKGSEVGNVVFLSAMYPGQSAPLPAPFAGVQGKISAMVMALSKEFGLSKVLVNAIAVGVLEGGISEFLNTYDLDAYKNFSALRRLGKAEEVAEVVSWIIRENTYMTGRTVPVNGGI